MLLLLTWSIIILNGSRNKAKGERELSRLQIDCDEREIEIVLPLNGVEHMCIDTEYVVSMNE